MLEKFKFWKRKPQYKLKPFLTGLILSLLAVFIIFTGIVGWGIYKAGWENDFIAKVSAVIPFPAAKVNGKYILYRDYIKSFNTARKFYSQQEAQGATDLPSDQEIKKMVLDERLVENVLVRQIAQKYKVSVSRAEIDANVEDIIKQNGSQQYFEEFLADYYDLNTNEYKKYFTAPNLLYDKVNEAILDDASLNGDAQKNIGTALSALRNGKKFDEVAKEYGQTEADQSVALNGDFFRGDLPQDLEDELYNLTAGQYTDVVSLYNSLQIIQLVKKDEQNGVLSLKSIAVKVTNIDDLLQEEIKKAQIKIYVY